MEHNDSESENSDGHYCTCNKCKDYSDYEYEYSDYDDEYTDIDSYSDYDEESIDDYEYDDEVKDDDIWYDSDYYSETLFHSRPCPSWDPNTIPRTPFSIPESAVAENENVRFYMNNNIPNGHRNINNLPSSTTRPLIGSANNHSHQANISNQSNRDSTDENHTYYSQYNSNNNNIPSSAASNSVNRHENSTINPSATSEGGVQRRRNRRRHSLLTNQNQYTPNTSTTHSTANNSNTSTTANHTFIHRNRHRRNSIRNNNNGNGSGNNNNNNNHNNNNNRYNDGNSRNSGRGHNDRSSSSSGRKKTFLSSLIFILALGSTLILVLFVQLFGYILTAADQARGVTDRFSNGARPSPVVHSEEGGANAESSSLPHEESEPVSGENMFGSNSVFTEEILHNRRGENQQQEQDDDENNNNNNKEEEEEEEEEKEEKESKDKDEEEEEEEEDENEKKKKKEQEEKRKEEDFLDHLASLRSAAASLHADEMINENNAARNNPNINRVHDPTRLSHPDLSRFPSLFYFSDFYST